MAPTKLLKLVLSKFLSVWTRTLPTSRSPRCLRRTRILIRRMTHCERLLRLLMDPPRLRGCVAWSSSLRQMNLVLLRSYSRMLSATLRNKFAPSYTLAMLVWSSLWLRLVARASAPGQSSRASLMKTRNVMTCGFNTSILRSSMVMTLLVCATFSSAQLPPSFQLRRPRPSSSAGFSSKLTMVPRKMPIRSRPRLAIMLHLSLNRNNPSSLQYMSFAFILTPNSSSELCCILSRLSMLALKYTNLYHSTYSFDPTPKDVPVYPTLAQMMQVSTSL
mmetsp:Transcript_19660/g.34226  ORF Transcript_19660/g.34226 Transcript_19660/m.34226 type:complete len:275 (-) Transcript_19660:50-874(-)